MGIPDTPQVLPQSVPPLDNRGGDATLPPLFAEVWWRFFNSVSLALGSLFGSVKSLTAADDALSALITALTTVVNGLVNAPKPYDLNCAFVGNPAAGATVFLLTFVRGVSYLGNFSGARGSVAGNPTATATYTVNKNGSGIGTVAISTSGVFTFATTAGAAQSFAAGDVMAVTAPNPQDATLLNAAFTFAGART